jgi:hypothetical protein
MKSLRCGQQSVYGRTDGRVGRALNPELSRKLLPIGQSPVCIPRGSKIHKAATSGRGAGVNERAARVPSRRGLKSQPSMGELPTARPTRKPPRPLVAALCTVAVSVSRETSASARQGGRLDSSGRGAQRRRGVGVGDETLPRAGGDICACRQAIWAVCCTTVRALGAYTLAAFIVGIRQGIARVIGWISRAASFLVRLHTCKSAVKL